MLLANLIYTKKFLSLSFFYSTFSRRLRSAGFAKVAAVGTLRESASVKN